MLGYRRLEFPLDVELQRRVQLYNMRPRLTLILRAGCKARHLTCSRCYSTAQEPTIKSNSIPAPHSGSIRVLSLNRPSARNAISRQLLAELSKHVEEVAAEGESGGTRALVLASESDASFCAGADLKERATFTPEE